MSTIGGGILPIYQPSGAGSQPKFLNPLPFFISRRTIFRLREKYIIIVALALFLLVGYSAFIYLPDIAGSTGGGLSDADSADIKRDDSFGGRKHWRNNPIFRELVIPPPIIGRSNKTFQHEYIGVDPHKQQDSQRLWQQIQKDTDKNADTASKVTAKDGEGAAPGSTTMSFEEKETFRQKKIVEMMMHAWDGYAQYAWGANEVRPATKIAHSASIFGGSKIGASIVDGLDTIWIMGLKDRYEKGRQWIESSLSLKDVPGDMSVFETNIRYVGGLLSLYALTKDELYKTKAEEIATMLLPAFDTPTGIPNALINIKSKQSKNFGWASGGSSILSEFGTLHLEFEYLSIVTGNPVFRDKVMKIRNLLHEIEKPGGLYPNYLHPRTGKWGTKHVSLGALGDSFYEYLLKSWLVTNKRDVVAKQMYDEAVEAVEKELLKRSTGGLLYLAEMKSSRLEHKMDHLACFTGGMFGIQAVNEVNQTRRAHFLEVAKEITHTCHESYIRTDTKLGPESFRFSSPDQEAKAMNEREKYYILRPEVIEAYFYMWRVTHNPMYREWAWDATMAIEKYCKAEAGYSGIRNVYSKTPTLDDVQQSFFLAETLKYLYLIFSPDNVISLDEWVLNTEAHPIPVRLTDEEHAPPADGKVKTQDGDTVARL